MPQSDRQDLERGNDTDGCSDEDEPRQLPPLQSHGGEINNGDRSWPLYAMYSKVTEEEDNKLAERWLRATDGLLVFIGLFSATVAALLAVTIPDLKPSSQDTSAFYLENIYQLFANQNSSNGLIPSILAKPPAFSPPKYAVWANSLWSLSLLISLTNAMLVTFEQRSAYQYLRLTQNKESSPVTRARFHAKYTNEYGALVFSSGIYLLWLHLSLFLFAAGLLIYFFNINRTAFDAVVWWFAITIVLYMFATVTPFLDHDIMYDTQLSSIALRVYLCVVSAIAQVFSWMAPLRDLSTQAKKHHRDLSDRYRVGILDGNARFLQESASKPSPQTDAEVVERILLVLDEDQAFETFFNAIPGFCGSKLVQPLHSTVTTKLRQSLHRFLDRTFSSPLVPESVKNDRFITCLNAAHSALGSIRASQILDDFFHQHRDEALKSVELGRSLISWGRSTDYSINPIVRRIVACIIAHAKDRDDRWTKLVKEAFDLPDGVIRDYVARGDSVLLAILNHVTRQVLRTGRSEQEVLESLSQFDIHNTAAELRHDFCALWNEIVQEARNDGFGSTPTQILAGIRRLFVTLHRGTNAVPSQFPAPLDSIDDSDAILRWPPLYPSCDIPDHHPDSVAQGLAIATPPKSRIRRNSEPAIRASVVKRPQSSLRLRRTESYSHFSTVPLPTRPSHPPRSLPRPALVSQPSLSNSPDVVTKDTMPDFANISGILRTADPILVSSTTSGPTMQKVEKTGTTPPAVALGSLPTPLLTPALSHSTTAAMLPSSIDPTAAQTHLLHHPPGASTMTATPLSVSLQDTTVSDQQPGLGKTLEQDDIKDSRPLAQRVDPGQPPSGGATAL